MTVDISRARPRTVFPPRKLRRRTFVFLCLVAASVSIAASAEAQRKSSYVRPTWADTTGESDVYPIGDAVGVYRAILDLFYVDGNERPGVIVLWDTAQRQSGGPCAFDPCKDPWLHKSKIDTATILAYARQSPKRPRIINFRYRIPTVHSSQDIFERMAHDGYGYLAELPPEKVGGADAFWVGFRHKYPRAWGHLMLSKVGFNPRHTEALIGVFQACGESCRSVETVFLKRFGKKWRVIERIPESADAMQTAGNLRYRGPAGERPDQSQIVATDLSGSPPRAESDDAKKVYVAVLDRLYSFYGETPRSVVLAETRAYSPGDLPNHRSRIDSSTISTYNFYAQVRDALYPRFKYRVPISWVSDTALKELERAGAPLAKAAAERLEQEQSPLWYAFHAKYPGAWGYASLGKVSFNPKHTQALVFSRHFCGTDCVNADTWFIERRDDNWYVVERLPRDNQVSLGIDGLRYLGPEADPKWYRPRRARGVFSNGLTSEVLPSLDVGVYQQGRYFRTIRTDSEGRYTLDDLPLNSAILFKVRCPIAARSDSVYGRDFLTVPGMDTTIDVALDYRFCLHLNRAHPLIAGAAKANTATDSAYPTPADEAVYLGVLRTLYGPSVYENGRIMLQPFTGGRCNYCLEPEIPRLVRKNLMDPSTEINFAGLPAVPLRLRPLVPYRRKVEVIAPEDREFFQGSDAWDAMKDAYPGVNALIGFSRVGFNDSATAALVEIHTDSAKASGAPETMLLKRIGTEWRAVLRHVERGATSAEWSGRKCEAVDAPDRSSDVADIEKLIGDFEIVRVGASRAFRGQTDSLRIRLDPLRPSPRKANGMVATANMLDADDKPEGKIAGALEAVGSSAVITFTTRLPKGMIEFDGWIEQYSVLRTNGREFFGTWLTSNGPSAGLRGYFCARPTEAR